jgi:hypothetical protein
MTSATDGSGVVYQNEVFDILDTRDMAWRPLPVVVGAYAKVLSRDAEGQAATMVAWMGKGASALLCTKPEKAGEVFDENLFVLSGELPHLAGDDAKDITYLPQGTYMQRRTAPSEALRSKAADVETPVGSTVLIWRTDGWV